MFTLYRRGDPDGHRRESAEKMPAAPVVARPFGPQHVVDQDRCGAEVARAAASPSLLPTAIFAQDATTIREIARHGTLIRRSIEDLALHRA
jgi:hypothetical protein